MTKSIALFFILISVSLLLSGCGRNDDPLHVSPEEGDTVKDSPTLSPNQDALNTETGKPEKPSPPSPPPSPTGSSNIMYRWNGRAGSNAWTQYTFEAVDDYDLDSVATPNDILYYCPKFKTLNSTQRKQFWTFLISSIANLESNFDPTAKYLEKFAPYHYSRGLLQLGYLSTEGYRCKIPKPQDLHLPEYNLNCGVKILDYWVSKDGLIAGGTTKRWRGGARYWAVLRFKSKQIKTWTKTLPFCV